MLITLAELAEMMHLDYGTARNRSSRAPQTLPPRCRLPGNKRALYRLIDVERWLAENAETRKRPVGRPRKN